LTEGGLLMKHSPVAYEESYITVYFRINFKVKLCKDDKVK